MSSRRRPEMNSLLDETVKGDQKLEKGARGGRSAAYMLALGLLGVFIIGIIYLGEIVTTTPVLHPIRGFLFPLLAVTTIALLLPLIFYVSFQEEFRDLNPAFPSHYLFLLKKSFIAIKNNDFKVEAKNL